MSSPLNFLFIKTILMAKTENFEDKKNSLKAELLAKCSQAGCGTKPLVFNLNRGAKNLIIPCTTTITYKGAVFNLRYSRKFDTPFEEEQSSDISVSMDPISISDGQLVTKDRALSMFLCLHPHNSKNGKFMLEDKEEEERLIIEEEETRMQAVEKISTSQIDELQACYNVLTGADPSGLESRTLKCDLYLKARTEAKRVLAAFGDKKTLVKYKLFTALKLGYIQINSSKTELTWKGGGNIINVLPNQNVFDAFAELCLSENGAEVYEMLNKQLSK